MRQAPCPNGDPELWRKPRQRRKMLPEKSCPIYPPGIESEEIRVAVDGESHRLAVAHILAYDAGSNLTTIRRGEAMPTEEELLDRITVRSGIFGGKPIIRDMRIAVEHVLGMLASGDTPETILSEYEFLEAEDIQACLLYAHRSLAGEQVHDRMTVR